MVPHRHHPRHRLPDQLDDVRAGGLPEELQIARRHSEPREDQLIDSHLNLLAAHLLERVPLEGDPVVRW